MLSPVHVEVETHSPEKSPTWQEVELAGLAVPATEGARVGVQHWIEVGALGQNPGVLTPSQKTVSLQNPLTAPTEHVSGEVSFTQHWIWTGPGQNPGTEFPMHESVEMQTPLSPVSTVHVSGAVSLTQHYPKGWSSINNTINLIQTQRTWMFTGPGQNPG